MTLYFFCKNSSNKNSYPISVVIVVDRYFPKRSTVASFPVWSMIKVGLLLIVGKLYRGNSIISGQLKGRLPLRAASFINRRCFYRYWTAICLTVSGCWAFSFFGIWTFSTPCSTLASILSASASSGSRSVCWNFS